MIRRDPMSNLFVAVCGACDLHEHINSDSGFGAASLATGAGWTLGLRDLCRDCSQLSDSHSRKSRR